MKLSIIIPAYNEEARIRPTLDAYARYFVARYAGDVEFLVVVNGSYDGTEQIVRERAKRCSQVKLMVEPRAIGKGGAIFRGFEAAAGDLVGFVDADNSTSPEAFDDLVARLGDAGAIIASRYIPGAKVSPRQPWSRRVASRVFNFLVRAFFKLNITDTQCGAKLMKREAIKAVMPELGLTRWAFDVDLLFQLRRAGYRIVETPTVWRDREGSRLKVGRVSLEMFLAVCRLRLLYSPFRWLVKGYDRTLGRIIRLKI